MAGPSPAAPWQSLFPRVQSFGDGRTGDVLASRHLAYLCPHRSLLAESPGMAKVGEKQAAPGASRGGAGPRAPRLRTPLGLTLLRRVPQARKNRAPSTWPHRRRQLALPPGPRAGAVPAYPAPATVANPPLVCPPGVCRKSRFPTFPFPSICAGVGGGALRRHQLPQTVGRTPSRPAQARATTRSVSRRSPPAPRAPGAHAFSLTALRLTAALCRTARHYPWKEELQARQKKPPGREIAMYTLMFLAVPGPSASTADALDEAFPAKAFGVNLTESCTLWLCRVRAGRSFGSARRAAARRQWVVKPSIASMGWVVLWPACSPGVPLPRTARPLGCAVSRAEFLMLRCGVLQNTCLYVHQTLMTE